MWRCEHNPWLSQGVEVCTVIIPVVPHKVVAEASKIGHHRYIHIFIHMYMYMHSWMNYPHNGCLEHNTRFGSTYIFMIFPWCHRHHGKELSSVSEDRWKARCRHGGGVSVESQGGCVGIQMRQWDIPPKPSIRRKYRVYNIYIYK